MDLTDRYQGALLGLACGDAVGTTVEFSPRGSFEPMTDMVGGGPFRLQPGQWTDDTSMALCLATSLVHCGRFDAVDQMNRYVNWWQWGYLSATGECFDIGLTTANALQRYVATKDPMAGSVDPLTAGNGSLMRLAPVVMFFHPDVAEVLTHAGLSSMTTHAAPEAVECCRLFGEMLVGALSGRRKSDVLTGPALFRPECPRVRAIAEGAYLAKGEAEITASGYSVHAMEAALWCFAHSDSFEALVLKAANLGDDADTVAAIAGQLGGAFYGRSGIPERWLQRLAMRDEIERLADALFTQAARRRSPTQA